MKQNKLFTLFSLTLLSTGTPLTSIVQAGTIIKDAPAITAAPNNDTKIVNKKEATNEQKTGKQKNDSEATDSQKVDKQETVIPTTDEQASDANPSSIPQALSEAVKAKTLTWGDAPWAFDKDSGILALGSGQLNEANNSPWSRTDGKAINADDIKKIVFSGITKAPGDSRRLFGGLKSLTQIVGLEDFDTSKVREMSGMFQGASALTSLDLSELDTSKVRSTISMFEGCSSLISLNFSKFDTSSLTNLSYMFKGCTSLKTLDLSSFNTSEVTTMRGMFSNTSLIELTLGDKFHFIGTDCELMLSYPSDALREGKYVTGNWVNKVNQSVAYSPTDFMDNYGTNGLRAGTYVAEAKALVWGDAPVTFDTDLGVLTINSGTLSQAKYAPWNGSDDKKIDGGKIKKIIFTGPTKVSKSAEDLFRSLNNLTEIEGLTNLDTSDVTTMLNMFRDCSSLVTLDLSNFNTKNVTDIRDMFRNCTSLTSLDPSKFNTKKVTDMRGTFRACTSLKSLDLSNFDTSGVTTLNKLFEYVPLARLTLGSKFRFVGNDSNLSAPTALTNGDQLTGRWIKKNRNTFSYSTNDFTSQYGKKDLTAGTYIAEVQSPLVWGDAPYKFDTDSGTLIIESGRLDTSSNSPWNRKNGKSIDKKLIKKIIFTGTIKAPSNSSNLFGDLPSLTNIVGLGQLDTSDVTTMLNMFRDCSSLVKLNLSNFNTTNVTDIRDMFRNCTSLTTLDVSKFNTAKVTDMRGAFRACISLTSLDLSSFDTSGVTTLNKLFEYVPLTSLKLGNAFRFRGDECDLSAPAAINKEDKLTGKWIRQDGNSKAYSPKDFIDKYGSEDLKSGTYVAETEALKWGGTSYSFDTDSGVLIVGPGTLSTSGYSPWNREDGKGIDSKLIKKISFTGATKA
ncbi:BspA family leucine-rich repeat surface protein, partial [Lactococcus piscium]|uniref:BspA family leucine-rich repeat surface protein n=1 Tax=Pseudolactococcus carnosus TaxID=2749961 RepID=UPI001FBAF4AC